MINNKVIKSLQAQIHVDLFANRDMQLQRVCETEKSILHEIHSPRHAARGPLMVTICL